MQHKGRQNNAEWVKQSRAMRQKLGVSQAARPWTSRAQLCGVAGTQRELDVIDLAWISQCHRKRARTTDNSVAKGFWVNYSQSAARKPWGPVRTVTTSNLIYSYELDRRLLPVELLRVLGHGNVDVDGMDATEVNSIAGEAMAPPCLGVAVYAVVLGAAYPGFWSTPSP
jgi:hypothetical protein